MASQSDSVDYLYTCLEKSCKAPKKVFNTEAGYKTHCTRYHRESYDISFINSNGIKQEGKVQRTNGKLHCPICASSYLSSDSLKYHLEKRVCDKTDVNEFDNDFDDQGVDLDRITVPTTSNLSTIQPTTHNHDARHNYDQAVTHACNSASSSVEDHKMNVWILKKMGLEPFALMQQDAHDRLIEYNGLSHHENIRHITGGTFECSAIIPAKRKVNDVEECVLAETTLATMIHRSPYKVMLLRNRYHQLDSSMTMILNQDWDLHPEAKYVCAQLLAGSILLSSNGEAILINTIEMYGRTKTIDIHRETSSESSSIPPDNTLYPNVYPMRQYTNEGPKLVIGMQTCSGLITSRLRLDVAESPKVGPTASAFEVDSQTKIYIDDWSMRKATELNNKATRSIESFTSFIKRDKSDPISAMRQVIFHVVPPVNWLADSTANLSPYTLTTTAHVSLHRESSKLIGVNVIKSPKTTILDKVAVDQCCAQCPNNQTTCSVIVNKEFTWNSGPSDLRKSVV